MLTVSQVVVWIIIGLIGGTLAGLVITGDRSGFGWWRNLLLGLAGAALGGLVFWTFNILPELNSVSVSLRDIIAALVGSLLVLFFVWLWQKWLASSRHHDHRLRPS